MAHSTLCSLPFDLIYIVLSFADWRDILSLGRTSRRYQGLAHSLPVWIQAAQSIPRKYLIPRNTFSLDGLGVKELQRLIARPEQIRNGCRTTGQEGFICIQEKSCTLPSSLWIHSAIIVPGGRWLITGHTNGRMKMWDLNAPLDDKNRFACVHSAQLPGCQGHLGVLLIQRSSDQNGVVVLTESLEHDDPKGYNLGVVQFTLDGPNGGSEPICHTWGAFTGNDTIALEGNYVAAEHQGTTRIWDWKRKLFSAYQWDLSLSNHPNDPIEEGERIDITIRPPYVYLIHNRLRIFAAFRIPPMQYLDVFADTTDWPEDGNLPPVDFIRPEIVLDLTSSYTLYHALEVIRPHGERVPYEHMRLSNITGVQFINPWSLQVDNSPENPIPFFITVSNSDGSHACLMRYDVTQSPRGGYVNRPLLKQIIDIAGGPSLDIVSPTLVTDDFGTFWGTERGLLYAVDSPYQLNSEEMQAAPVESMCDLDTILPQPVMSRIVVHESSQQTMRHRVGFDMVSGRKFKVVRSQITISDYLPHAQSPHTPSSSGMRVDES